MRTLPFARPYAVTAFFAAIVLFPARAPAQMPVDVGGRLSLQYLDEAERALTAGRDQSFSEEAVVSVRARPAKDVTAFGEARALNTGGGAGFEDDTGRTISRAQSFIEAREFWLRRDNLGGHVPLYMQAGRQRLREPRSLWWNSNTDMVRLGYDATLYSGFIGIGEDLASYRAGHENDFPQRDEGRLRLLGEASWQYRYNHFIEGRFLAEHDHSGIERTGSIIDAGDRDNEDLDAVWAGLRSVGEFNPPQGTVSKLKYRADVIGLLGDVDTLATTAGPGVNQRTVAGAASGDLRAWAFDGSVILETELPARPVFTAGYAYGSGDSNPGGGGDDHAFRQTGLHGGNSRLGLGRTHHKNYGEVLRPELSNLHILTAGVDFPLATASDIGFTYFNYSLAKSAGGLRSSGISAALGGADRHIGQAVDMVLNVDVDGEFGVTPPATEGTEFRFIVGSFFPGSAYTREAQDAALRVFTEIRFRF